MYQDLATKIVNQWRDEIESIDSSGMSRKAIIDLFSIKGDKGKEFPCYKVNFIFEDGFYHGDEIETHIKWRDDWSKKLNKIFYDKFFQKEINDISCTFTQKWSSRSEYNSGETSFNNDKVDYMTYQGYRFIIQFYPLGFISEIRNEKISILGI